MKNKPKRKNILYIVTFSSGHCEPLVANSITDLKNKYYHLQVKYGLFMNIMPIASQNKAY